MGGAPTWRIWREMILLRDATQNGGAGPVVWNDLNNGKWRWDLKTGMSDVSIDHIR